MKQEYRPSKSKAMLNKAMPYFRRYKDNYIRKVYVRRFRDFLRYCTLFHKIEKIEELEGNIGLIREYTVYLREQGLTTSEIYVAIVPVCRFCNVDTANFR